MKYILQVLFLIFVLSPALTIAAEYQRRTCSGNTCVTNIVPPMVDDTVRGVNINIALINDDAQVGSIRDVKVTGYDASINTHNNYYTTTVHSRCDLGQLNNVPATVSYYQERVKESQTIVQAIANAAGKKSGVVIVCVTGFPGFGKTELAKRYALTHRDRYHHTRFFDASSEETLFTNYKKLAMNLCNQDINICYSYEGNSDVESCIIEIVNRCLRELKKTDSFLWLFDNVKNYGKIKKYIPQESGIRGIILITARDKRDFDYTVDNIIEFNNVMTPGEACALLAETILQKTKVTAVDTICQRDEIEKIAIVIKGKLPLLIVCVADTIALVGSCDQYIEAYENESNRLKNIDKVQEQELEIRNEIAKANRLNLDVLGLLSFVNMPVSQEIIRNFIYANGDKYKDILPLISFDPRVKSSIGIIDNVLINRAISNFELVKAEDNKLSFPHELFDEQTRLFLLDKDRGDPGSYRRLFDNITDFFHANFSGCFWNEVIWSDNKEDILLLYIDRVVDNFMLGKISRIRPLSDNQLELVHRLAKYYIEMEPRRAIRLLSELDRIIVAKETAAKESSYVLNSINHASVMQNLVVAYCQKLYREGQNNSMDLGAMGRYAEAVYSTFERQLGRGDSRTLNACLLLAHIKTNLKSEKLDRESYKVKFLGSEPTIDAAIEFAGFNIASDRFSELRKVLSNPRTITEDYLSIYDRFK